MSSYPPPPRSRSDWRLFVHLTGGSVVILHDGLEEGEARERLMDASTILADHEKGLMTGALGGPRGSVRLSAVEAVSIKDFRAVAR